jgi:hypothetical protein
MEYKRETNINIRMQNEDEVVEMSRMIGREIGVSESTGEWQDACKVRTCRTRLGELFCI